MEPFPLNGIYRSHRDALAKVGRLDLGIVPVYLLYFLSSPSSYLSHSERNP